MIKLVQQVAFLEMCARCQNVSPAIIVQTQIHPVT